MAARLDSTKSANTMEASILLTAKLSGRMLKNRACGTYIAALVNKISLFI
jgi:hypothetical protein